MELIISPVSVRRNGSPEKSRDLSEVMKIRKDESCLGLIFKTGFIL